MIKDASGLSKVGLALLRNNLDKLAPAKSIELKIRGEQQIVIVTGPMDSFESCSFGWGRADERTTSLAKAAAALGWPLPVETFQDFPASEDHLIKKW